MMQLPLVKAEAAKPFQLAMTKVDKIFVKLFWNSKHDLDAHALSLQDGKIENWDDVLSTYNKNLIKVDAPNGAHLAGTKGAFRTLSGSMVHLGDSRSGLVNAQREPDETIEIYLNKLGTRNEVPFFITNHPPSTATFKEISDVVVLIEDSDGKELIQAFLSNDFQDYGAVQCGAITKNTETGAWDFFPVARGIEGDNGVLSAGTFNHILAQYSPT